MFQRKPYPNYRTVSSVEKNGRLLIRIDPVSNWRSDAVGLIIVSVSFGCGCWMFASAFFKVRTLTEAFYCLPFVAFLLWWFRVTSGAF